MVISTNMSAQITSRNLAESSGLLSRSLARLSSGSKLTSPEDDAAGLAVSTRFEAQVSRIGAAVNNLNNAVSYTQTQDGFLGKVSKALDRMSELSVLSQDVTKTNSDRSMYDSEFQTLGSYVRDIATKDFNGVSLFDGTTRAVTTDGEGNSFNMTGFNLSGGAYATGVSGDITTTTTAFTALGNVKSAIVALTTDRATIGANLSRINYTTDQLGVLKTNLNASDSRIKDVDVAEESTNYAKYNILVQAGTAMLAQANSQPQGALRLLG
jgi:flagellin